MTSVLHDHEFRYETNPDGYNLIRCKHCGVLPDNAMEGDAMRVLERIDYHLKNRLYIGAERTLERIAELEADIGGLITRRLNQREGQS